MDSKNQIFHSSKSATEQHAPQAIAAAPEAILNPLRGWHITYSIISALFMVVFFVWGIIFVVNQLLRVPGNGGGLWDGGIWWMISVFSIPYGLIVVAILSGLSVILLPFYVIARKRAGLVKARSPKRNVRPGIVFAVTITITVIWIAALLLWSWLFRS